MSARLMQGWVQAQIDPWRDRKTCRQTLEDLENANDGLFLLSFSGEGVSYREKPVANTQQKLFARRAKRYANMLGEVYATYCQGLRYDVMLCVHDTLPGRFDVPIFHFQKPSGSSAILLPDVDFIGSQYYDAPRWKDDIPFFDKTDTAIFVGSTTGGGLITEAALQANQVPRINAAIYFKRNPRVTFKLPNICHYADEATRDMLASLDLGSERIPWKEQFRSKLLLSMDGNGATCSRVALALGSNSVLVKYDSPHRLYYFDGLERGVHYVEVAHHAEVEAVLDDLVADPGRYAELAKRSKDFHDTYLTKAAILEYTGLLIRAYVGLQDGR
ncbi:MAG: hypothetical protein HC861_09405 [Rhodospirillaceae bacterium]|nr:hypothetical protein [Rhodospirillaceae bacterium]